MPSYLSSSLSTLLTTTTSKYTTLRRQLLPLSSDDRDGDTEDDTHVCRVLRAYYTEKQRPYPAWLPADPRRPNSGGGQGSYSGGGGVSGTAVAAGYGSWSGQQRPSSGAQGGRGLSDLFGPSGGSAGSTPSGSLRRSEGSALRVQQTPSQSQSQGQQQYQSQSQGQAQAQAQLYPTTSNQSQGLRPTTSPMSSLAPHGTAVAQQPIGARPLPSQREGSYQSLRLGRQPTPQGGQPGQGQDEYGMGGGQPQQQQPPPMTANTAQDRLKAKLWGGSGGRRG